METYKVHPTQKEYREEYLRSDDWRQKSTIILNRDKICFICEKVPATDTHHLTYERLGVENLETDLIGICRKCHNRIHKHELLQSVKNKNELKQVFFKSYKKYVIKENLYKKIINLNRDSLLIISGLFKLPITELNFLKNKEVDYFTMQVIFKLLNTPKKFKQLKQKKKNNRGPNFVLYELKKEKEEFKKAKKEAKKLLDNILKLIFQKQKNILLTFRNYKDILFDSLNLIKSKQIAFYTLEKELYDLINTQKLNPDLIPVLKDCYLTLKKDASMVQWLT
jgi:hypothetical protein